MKAWRAGDRVVVQRGEAYLLLDAKGAVLERFAPRTFSDEDDLWITEQLFVGDRLIERSTVEHRGVPHVRDEKVIAEGLVAIEDPFVDAAIGADDAAQVKARQERARIAELRVTAIEGALDDFGLGKDFARAQAALLHRVRVWDDKRAAGLIRTLVVLARARPSEAVVVAFTRGCLLAAFEYGAPKLIAEQSPTPNPELAARLEAHAKSIDADSVHQSEIDARHNAISLGGAAVALAAAAKMLR